MVIISSNISVSHLYESQISTELMNLLIFAALLLSQIKSFYMLEEYKIEIMLNREENNNVSKINK